MADASWDKAGITADGSCGVLKRLVHETLGVRLSSRQRQDSVLCVGGATCDR